MKKTEGVKEINLDVSAQSRDVRYDLLRIIAACMVVFLHVSAAKWDVAESNSIEWATMNLYDSLVRSAVPIFFMLSGAFMLRKEISIKRLYLGKILPLVAVYIFWSVFYAIDYIGISGLKETSLISFVKIVLDSKYHLWFLPTLIGLYILQPVLFSIVNFKQGKYVPYFLICFFCGGVLRSTILVFLANHATVSATISKIPLELTGYSGYMILGYYLANMKKIKMKASYAVLIFLGIGLIAAGIGQLDALRTGSASCILYGYSTVPVFLEAILAFVFIQNIKPEAIESPKVGLLLQKGAALTMGVYLFHPFIIELLESALGINSLSFMPLISIPVITFIVAGICGFVTYIMTKIPVIKNLWKV